MAKNAIPGLVTVFGGSGFVGRHVVKALAKRGYQVRVAVRRPDLAGHLQPLGNVGQIQMVQANLRYHWSIERACEGADVVINLVGILAESGKQKFDTVQAHGARAIAEAANRAGAKLVHVSSLSCDLESKSDYARSKAKGEQAVLRAVSDAIIIRPSVVFGPEDDFFNKFASLSLFTPVLPAIGGGHTKFQPVYVGDVAAAIARAVDGNAQAGTIYELGGPDVVSLRQCMEILLEVIQRKRLILTWPWWISRIDAWFLQWLPNPPLTVDQVTLLEQDNVVSRAAEKSARTLQGLGIQPTNMKAILPSYLVRFKPHGQFASRGEA